MLHNGQRGVLTVKNHPLLYNEIQRCGNSQTRGIFIPYVQV